MALNCLFLFETNWYLCYLNVEMFKVTATFNRMCCHARKREDSILGAFKEQVFNGYVRWFPIISQLKQPLKNCCLGVPDSKNIWRVKVCRDFPVGKFRSKACFVAFGRCESLMQITLKKEPLSAPRCKTTVQTPQKSHLNIHTLPRCSMYGISTYILSKTSQLWVNRLYIAHLGQDIYFDQIFFPSW